MPPGIPTVGETSFTFRVDVRSDINPPRRDAHVRGVVHATRADADGAGREEHAFAWLEDGDRRSVCAVLAHLFECGFDVENLQFLPYSSKENWVRRYPHACPYIECVDGMIRGVPCFEQCVSTGPNRPARDADAAAADEEGMGEEAAQQPAKKKRRVGGTERPAPKIIPSATLSDDERSQLHIEMYNYLAWLDCELSGLNTSGGSRQKVRRAGISIPGIRDMLGKLESSFRDVEEYKRNRHEGSEEHDGEGEDGGGEGGGSEKENNSPEVPLLEKALATDLGRLVEEAKQRKQQNDDTEGSGEQGMAAAKPRAPRDFDTLYNHLVAYKQRNGDTKVPQMSKEEDEIQLGRWVGELKVARKKLRARGLEHHPDDHSGMVEVSVPPGRLGLVLRFWEDANRPGATVIGVAKGTCPIKEHVRESDIIVTCNGKLVSNFADLRGGERETRRFGILKSPPVRGRTYLTLERVRRLDSLGFDWAQKKGRPFDEWLELLKQYLEEHDGQWPTRHCNWHNIGIWMHTCRRSYAVKNKKFMVERAPKLDAIGFPWVVGTCARMCWDDNFDKLVDFRRVNGHTDVPRPKEVSGDSPEAEAQFDKAMSFYNWVQKQKLDFGNYQEGNTSRMGEESYKKLLGIDFRPRRSLKSTAAVPSIPFERRLEQLQKVRDEIGHLDIDHRYRHLDNLGGWAAEMSRKYKDWRDGNETSPLAQQQFGQLQDVGFRFESSAGEPHDKRTWQENFEAFLRFREEWGHSNVPIQYKADRRLGVWVSVQRKEYRLWQAGKKSRMTEERYDILRNASFCFEVDRAGHDTRELFKKARSAD